MTTTQLYRCLPSSQSTTPQLPSSPASKFTPIKCSTPVYWARRPSTKRPILYSSRGSVQPPTIAEQPGEDSPHRSSDSSHCEGPISRSRVTQLVAQQLYEWHLLLNYTHSHNNCTSRTFHPRGTSPQDCIL